MPYSWDTAKMNIHAWLLAGPYHPPLSYRILSIYLPLCTHMANDIQSLSSITRMKHINPRLGSSAFPFGQDP